MFKIRYILLLLLLLIPFQGAVGQKKMYVRDFDKAIEQIDSLLTQRIVTKNKIKIDTFYIYNRKKKIEFRFTRALSEYPIRNNDTKEIYRFLREQLPDKYKKYDISIVSNKSNLDELSSRYFSNRQDNRHKSPKKKSKWIINESRPYTPREGLHQQYIALWSGHGYYYDLSEQRWKWQRAPYFTTIEDLFTHDYITTFIAPMLENAGCYVMIPRERDHSTTEIVVDYGSPFYNERNNTEKGFHKWNNTQVGYEHPKEPLKEGDNPFTSGTGRAIEITTNSIAQAAYLPYFPETERLSVYISYQSVKNSTKDAKYTVRHISGETTFRINQNIGGGTWVYLGEFTFAKGESGHGVIVSTYKSENNNGKILTTDAVRFGGGYGNVSREGKISHLPKYAEGSRYYLQSAGFSPDVYFYTEQEKEQNDYKDDYFSKGLWINELVKKYNVPLSLGVGIHTDAGRYDNDSTIGTLAIYTRFSENKDKYPDGTSRTISRELADIIQTQIVEDMRNTYASNWNRRPLWDRSYVEARVPEIPSILLEMFSHQNFQDMKYGLDPKIQFTISRSIYKGILKYVAFTQNREYTVQPLPIKNFSTNLYFGNKPTAQLQWEERIDPLEESATADHYIVYTQVIDINNTTPSDFDQGTIVYKNKFSLAIESDKIYNFKVTAVNKGGESFPSETLSVGYTNGRENTKALIINNFYKTGSSSYFDTDILSSSGNITTIESGSPYIASYSYTGSQYNFDINQQWNSDYLPGYGASHLDYAAQRIAGNTFDYPITHGIALLQNGISFASSSATGALSNRYEESNYQIIDIIFGKESANEKIFSEEMVEFITKQAHSGKGILLSGAHISKAASEIPEFGKEILKCSYANSNATSSGKIISEDGSEVVATIATSPNSERYCAESTEALLPSKGAKTLFRYSGSNSSAAVAYQSDKYDIITMGFPIETITSQHQINEMMREVIAILKR